MDYPKLEKPPVVEAVMGISLLDNEYWAEYYKSVVEIIQHKYSVVNERVVFRVSEKNTYPEQNRESIKATQVIKDGYTLSNPDSKKTVLLKPDSIQITKKAPYIEWDDLFVEFIDILQALNRVAPSVLFFKPYLRYRNGFFLPIQADESMGNHFTVVHSIPNILTKLSISNMSFTIDMLKEEFGYKIEQRLKPSGKIPSAIDVVMNIDVLNNAIQSSSVDEIRDATLILREKKNQLFFSLLTEETLKFFL